MEPASSLPFPFSSMMCQLSVVESKSATFPSEKARHLLDDSVLESRSPRKGLTLTSSTAVTNGLSLGKRLQPACGRRRGHRPAVCVLLSGPVLQGTQCPFPCSAQRQSLSQLSSCAPPPLVAPKQVEAAAGPVHGTQLLPLRMAPLSLKEPRAPWALQGSLLRQQQLQLGGPLGSSYVFAFSP